MVPVLLPDGRIVNLATISVIQVQMGDHPNPPADWDGSPVLVLLDCCFVDGETITYEGIAAGIIYNSIVAIHNRMFPTTKETKIIQLSGAQA